jgi:DNA polymerase-3 subunit delta'
MWERVVGQERAVLLLQRAAERPSHAYLLAGPAGSGVTEAARCLAAALVCPEGGCGSCEACRRALSGRHPDVVEVEPAGTFVVVDQVEEMIREAFTSPFEAPHKVIVLSEADRMNEPAANKLLKSLEEPPERTHFLLLSDAPDELLPTVRSRCQRIDFAALPDAVVQAVLEQDGVDPAAAARTARLAAGRLDRARRLSGEWAPLRQTVLEAASSLDGTGAAAARAAERMGEAVAAALQALETAQRREEKALEAELGEAGYPERVAKRLRRDMEQRHQRAARRARTDAVEEAVTALETRYRDLLLSGSDGDACLRALDACRSARAVLANRTAVNEALLLEQLLLRLPAG